MSDKKSDGAAVGSTELLDAIDGLWGVCESLCLVVFDMIDSKDSRIVTADAALTKAQDAIQKLMESNAPAHPRRDETLNQEQTETA